MSPEAAHIAQKGNAIAQNELELSGNAISGNAWDEISMLGRIYTKVTLADKMLSISKDGGSK